MVTPFAWLAQRFELQPRSLRWASLAALIASVLIIVTGGVVRLSGSGLGCDTWPSCTTQTLVATPELGMHGLIEFGNRLLTVVLCAIVGWLIIATRLQRESVPVVRRWAWTPFWIVVLNAIVGGVTVWMRLSPYIVAAHFIAATLLLSAATVTWHKVNELDSKKQHVPTSSRRVLLGALLLAATALLVVLGTLVTGSGPHAGDSSDVARMTFDWSVIATIHGGTAVIVAGLAVALWVDTRSPAMKRPHLRISVFICILAAQGAVGAIQVATALPEAVVLLHLLGSALVSIGAIRVFLDTRNAAAGNSRWGDSRGHETGSSGTRV